ncbi:hypothetical protein GS597_04740 [Synechococcales cyanobacterium C]|uniref:Uncharacterized protein n=1 Tax=Petrachloros mirabilis ULC683 TaxID=2781853 RepID=A0A8K1ZY86_9CYAN|nr:hypothetical protein [Petrachloros mirabilis ULC683]
MPGTTVTVLVISIAFLRFYDPTDLTELWLPHSSRAWSNLFTVAAILAALANFGTEWYRRNRETGRRSRDEARRVAQERAEAAFRAEEAERRSRDETRRVAQERAETERRSEEEARRVAQERAEAAFRAEEAERAARRARVQARCSAAQIRFQLDPSAAHREQLSTVLVFLEEYGDTL